MDIKKILSIKTNSKTNIHNFLRSNLSNITCSQILCNQKKPIIDTIVHRASTRRRAMYGRLPWPCGRSWTWADGSPTSTCRTRKWSRACDDCIAPRSVPTPMARTAAAKRIPITFSTIYRNRPRARRIFTIWCWIVGDVRRRRGRPSGRSRCFSSGRTSATRPRPDIERPVKSRSTWFVAVATRARLNDART